MTIRGGGAEQSATATLAEIDSAPIHWMLNLTEKADPASASRGNPEGDFCFREKISAAIGFSARELEGLEVGTHARPRSRSLFWRSSGFRAQSEPQTALVIRSDRFAG